MKALPQVLFWLGLISIPFAWLVWYFGPQLEVLRPVLASISDPALRAALQEAHAPGIESNPGKENAGIKTPSPLLTNYWFSIGRVERSSRRGGKFHPKLRAQCSCVLRTSFAAAHESGIGTRLLPTSSLGRL